MSKRMISTLLSTAWIIRRTVCGMRVRRFSMRAYESKVAVPTWNYTAVHAYGTAVIVDAEPALQMVASVVAFKIRVDKL